ncbi:LLM class flavin-dependent oxidoreductase [Micromonospora sp. RHAY321]|uniref:LLM class flavin-dependent oxidoreductase n=1 Tax=Micromonospora sp. RHAY321 TaxID=2944807 RepID=UPI00207C85FD|nr:LLM class flavin-dependent oxidoreductase [Micromonospora sp. RHAY321]MCO1596984.1 LLM class flavin-dependent oxidoreductase [Micromonospora sp. RHAY321]
MPLEIGLITFGELTADPATGRLPEPRRHLRSLVELAQVADQGGLDVIGVGEHHRSDFVATAPPMVLAAMAEHTSRIRLTSAVTVLSSDDPVRLWEQFATLDLLSGGRAEIIAGRGSYTDSFPLFGYDLADYAELFREKLDLLLRIRETNPLTWAGGRFRPPLHRADIAPRALQETLPVWVGVGGSPTSALETGARGLPMMVGVLLGAVGGHSGNVTLYRRAAEQAGRDPATLRVGVAVQGYVGSSSQEARRTMYPYFTAGFRDNNHQRGQGFVLTPEKFASHTGPQGALVVGSAQEVIDKIAAYHQTYGISRLLLHIGFGGMPQAQLLASVERLATEVAPVLRRELAVPPISYPGAAAA